MGNSFTNVYVHLIFHTKSQGCKIREEDLQRIFHYIGGLIRSTSGCAFMVGGQPDHIHVLTTLPVSIALSDFVRDIKSNTSKWIKNIDPYYKGFAWQEGYGAFSVSESNKPTVVRYIETQKEHHRKLSAPDEFCNLLKKHHYRPDDIQWWRVHQTSEE